MRRVGLSEFIEEAQRELPDPIEPERDHDLLAKFGVERSELLDRMGGSP